MKAFAQRLLSHGEEAASVVILLETEWPVLMGKVGKGWVEGLRR